MSLTLLMNIYRLAGAFVQQVFPDIDRREQRITTLAVMKMLIQIEILEALQRQEAWMTPEGPMW